MLSPASPDPARPQNSWPRRLALWGPVVVYCAVIFGLSSVSNVPQLPSHVSDKEAHAVLYSGLGFLVARALTGGRPRAVTGWQVVIVLLIAGCYGLSDEFHQLFVPHRQFDLMDLSADLVGAACGTAGHWLWGIIGRGFGESRPT